MSIIKGLENKINEEIKSIGYDHNFRLSISNRLDLGEYQINDCMNLAKVYHESPIEIAKKVVAKLEEMNIFENINIAGPGFINLSLKEDYVVNSVNLMSEDIYNNIDKLEKKTVVIDYGGANVAKQLHVGHLRSANIGEALKRLAKTLGYEVIGDAHLGDYGRPLGLVIREIKERYPDLEYFNPDYKGDYTEVELPITNEDLEKIYPYASTKGKEDESYMDEAREITSKIQKHERGYYELWKKITDISKEDVKKIYDKLGVEFELWNGEADAVEYLDELLDIFKQKNLTVLSEGAEIVNVEKEEDNAPMPPLLLIKSNGTISYETTDLATILQRKKEVNPDEIWYVVDSRQSLHLEQVFRASRLAKLVDDQVKLIHIPFGTMNGKDGKPFKTRDGGVMSLKNLMSLVYDVTYNKITNESLSEEQKKNVAEITSIATLKYADLIPFVGTDYIFDIDKFSELEGKTGPYILYSTVRMNSLLNKAKGIEYKKYKKYQNKIDKDIILSLLKLPSVLSHSLEIKSLNEITDYLYELTSKYNKFYSEFRILDEEDKDLQESWLVLTKLVYDVNSLLLDILSIKVPEKM